MQLAEKRVMTTQERSQDVKICQMKTSKKLTPEIDEVCDEFLAQSMEFATRFANLSGLPEEKSRLLRGSVFTRCSEAVTKARVALLERTA